LKLVRKREAKEEDKKQSNQRRIEALYSVDRCSDCNSSELRLKHVEGTIVCTVCGIVQQSRVIDEYSEWRNFSSETSGGGSNNPSRVGGKLNHHYSNYGMDTQINGPNAKELTKWAERTT